MKLKLKLRSVVLAAILCCATATSTALADPFIPAAGAGTMKISVKSISADRRFLPAFGSATRPAHSSLSETRLQASGTIGLGGRWALQFDFRAAKLTRSTKARKGRPGVTSSRTGLQDQQIGIVRGLSASPTFAQAIALNVIVPTGKTGPNAPNLGDGHLAFEPQYQFGVRGARHGSFAVLSMGPRFYSGGAGTLFRVNGEAGRRLSRAFTGKLGLFYSTTLGAKGTTAFIDANVLRGAVFLQLSHGRLRPEIGYERDIAGAGRHAEQRFTFAVTTHY